MSLLKSLNFALGIVVLTDFARLSSVCDWLVSAAASVLRWRKTPRSALGRAKLMNEARRDRCLIRTFPFFGSRDSLHVKPPCIELSTVPFFRGIARAES